MLELDLFTKIFFEILKENISAMKWTTPPIIAAWIRSSRRYHETPKVPKDGIITINAIIEPLAKSSLVEIFCGSFSFNKVAKFVLVIKIKDTLYLVESKSNSWQVIKDSILMSNH